LEEILHPKSIAVIGATASDGVNFVSPLLEFGFRGKIYPVNPKYPEILGIKSYPRLRDIPDPVDYVISTVPASETPNVLADCPQKGVKCIHLYTGRFSETGRQEAAELEQRILMQVREYGIRLIGPNCMGIYYPKERISFADDFPKEAGTVGLISQSGGGAVNFVYLVSLRGIRFSKVISYGNALDFNECDFLNHLSQDPETKIILMYIEGIKDGKRFFNTIRRAASVKPVIIIKGGRGRSGARAVASHTASLAGSTEVWGTAVSQAGAISAQDFEEMADLTVSFAFMPPIRGSRIGIVGGGGGASVLAADQCEEAGLDIVPLPEDTREELKKKGIPIWDWIGNPADVSISGGAGITINDMLQLMADNQNFDMLMHITSDGFPRKKETTISGRRASVESLVKAKREISKPILAVVGEKSPSIDNHDHWRLRLLSEVRTTLQDANIPVYPTIGRAANCIRKLLDYYERRNYS